MHYQLSYELESSLKCRISSYNYHMGFEGMFVETVSSLSNFLIFYIIYYIFNQGLFELFTIFIHRLP